MHTLTNLFSNFPYNIKANYGFFHVYAFTMTMGIIIAILASYIKLKRQKVPLEPLIFSIIFIVPFSLIGASFFGKFGNQDGLEWYTWFYFWKGGMSIHGGVLFGCVVGLIFFWFVGQRYNVSLFVYADAIIPNILLGQIIGRWGNFFNHELLGDPTSYASLDWLPAFIRDNCRKLVDGHLSEQYYQPIFLYESFGNFCAWLIITFLLPNVSKWSWCVINKNKNINNNFYDGIPGKRKISKSYNKYFYQYSPTLLQVNSIQINSVSEETLNIKEKILAKSMYCRKLNNIYNPKKMWVTRCGVETGAYFFLWNLIRFILEHQRSDDKDLFIQYHRTADYAVLASLFVFGICIILISQFLSPYLFRKYGNVYEKDYIDLSLMSNWDMEKIGLNQLIIGNDNLKKNLNNYVKKSSSVVIGCNVLKFDDYFKINYNNWGNLKDNEELLLFKYSLSPTELGKKELGIVEKNIFSLDLRINVNKIKNKNHFKFKFNSSYKESLNDYFKKIETQKQIEKLVKNKYQHKALFNQLNQKKILEGIDFDNDINETKNKLIIYSDSDNINKNLLFKFTKNYKIKK